MGIAVVFATSSAGRRPIVTFRSGRETDPAQQCSASQRRAAARRADMSNYATPVDQRNLRQGRCREEARRSPLYTMAAPRRPEDAARQTEDSPANSTIRSGLTAASWKSEMDRLHRLPRLLEVRQRGFSGPRDAGHGARGQPGRVARRHPREETGSPVRTAGRQAARRAVVPGRRSPRAAVLPRRHSPRRRRRNWRTIGRCGRV